MKFYKIELDANINIASTVDTLSANFNKGNLQNQKNDRKYGALPYFRKLKIVFLISCFTLNNSGFCFFEFGILHECMIPR